jgi:hypothetical protein
MKMKAALTSMAMMLSCVALAQNHTVDFHKLNVGTVPPGWNCTQTGEGDAKWTIVREDYPPNFWNVLEQIGTGATARESYPTPSVYPICILDTPPIADGFVSVRFKLVSGKQDQAGGLIWRVKDANNYNIFRANALENDLTIYQTVNGRRVTKVRRWFPVTPNVWHSMRVDFKGDSHTVTYDESIVNIWFDNVFMEPGKIGVWTKADSVTMFDNFTWGSF